MEPPAPAGDQPSDWASSKRWAVIGTVCTVVATLVAVAAYAFPRSGPTGPSPVQAVAASMPTTELSLLNCAEGESAESRSSEAKTTVAFRNASTRKLELFWLDYEGRAKPYGSLQPGEAKKFDTFVSHPWLVRDEAGECVAVVEATEGAAIAVIR